MIFRNLFEENGYIIIKNYLKNDEINNIFSELSKVINYVMPKFEKSDLTFDEKYLILKKENDKLRQHFYNLIGKNLYLNNLWNKNRLINILKQIYNEPFFIDKVQIRCDTPDNNRLLPMHQERGQISTNEITG